MSAALYLGVSTRADKRDDDAARQRKRQDVGTSAASFASSATRRDGRSQTSTRTKNQARSPTAPDSSACGTTPPDAGLTCCYFGRSTASHGRA
jgi:hypothetical protein